MSNQYYPVLSSKVKIDDLPEQLSFVQGGINNLLEDILIKDYQVINDQGQTNDHLMEAQPVI